MPFAIIKLKIPAKRDEYHEVLEQHLLARPLRAGDSIECNWDALKSCIVSTTEEVVCRGKRKQPDLFEDSEEMLSPLIKAKEDAHLMMIQCSTSANRNEFRRHQRKVKDAVDNAKEECKCRVAKEGEAARRNGCTKWKSIRKLQLALAGRRPTRPTAVMKENGSLTQGHEEVRARWHQHFVKILNIPCAFNDEVIDTLPLLPPHLDLDIPPTEEQLVQALTKLKIRKAGVKSGILPDFILHVGVDLWDRMLEVMQKVWKEDKVAQCSGCSNPIER